MKKADDKVKIICLVVLKNELYVLCWFSKEEGICLNGISSTEFRYI
ncbi:hypothetical protein [Clostridium beijerinckii]|uniref:Uncharacterized protein n=1 Tax=Clostridium beijerinckii TaxID=1520 RepID=A0A9Q5GMY6_CLOBE|nr:hypothetical protein [Clostridium beijerinckii]AQS07239.1 hypothetical protein CLBIJ_46890 [Clostridium beijerinckii]MBA2887906.1 hypothetical protein [Clostridium beijerinckii]MBA2902688.1 hypothetical protein [Clostridium beijerinckii]MBA2912465.1 hypothetical protein [Clostridium beijerinckii]MBA9013129.1 hypothetical protein [Clostridium beijerinckii]